MGVARCARDRQVTLLSAQRDALLSKLAASKLKPKEATGSPCSSSEVTTELLTNLRSIEDRLERFRSLPPTPPRGLISALVSVSLDASHHSIDPKTKKMETVWNERIFEGYHGPKFIREHHAQTWRELLTSAEDLLRSSEWQEIAANDVSAAVSDTNLRLTWHHRLRPQLNHGNWTDEEDVELTKLVKHYGQHGKWECIAKDLATGRTAYACIQRWQTALNPDFRYRRVWTTEEDVALLDILKRLLEHYPPSLIEWDVVAAFHTTRSSKECRTRARLISPAFATVMSYVPHPRLSRSRLKNLPSTMRPFTPNEDLQLLMGIQRYGLAGGRMGIGGGVGVGSWALICSALPGRTPRTCQKRYLELCEQFRPWTYTEDRKLYQSRLQLASNSSITDEKQLLWNKPFYKLVKHFPGRSMLALKKRFMLLYRFSRIWAALRKLTEQETRLAADGSSNEPGESSRNDQLFHETFEMRQLLLYSPFTAVLISRLRNQGVFNPEAEALRLLTSWEKGKSLTSEFSNIPEKVDMEFCQLLEDLDNDRLTPCPLISDVPENTATDDHLSETDDQDENGFTFTSQPVWYYSSRRIVSLVLTKQFIIKPVRKCLLSTLNRSLIHKARWSNPAMIASMVNTPDLCTQLNYLKSSHFTSGTRNKAAAALLLLKDRNRFGVALDRAMKLQKVVHALSKRNTIASLPNIAPIISGSMIRQVSREAKPLNPPDKAPLIRPEARELQASTSNANILTSLPKTSNAKANRPHPNTLQNAMTECDQKSLYRKKRSLVDQLGGRRCNLLIAIRRLLSRRGARGTDAYSLNRVSWLSEQTEASTSTFEKKQARAVPLILRQLPWRIAHEFQRDPKVIMDACLGASRGSLLDGLGLTCVMESENESSRPIRVIPPNYATIFALKSLLLHIPLLVRRSQNRFSQYIRARAALSHSISSSSEVVQPDSENSNPTDQFDPNFLESREVILSPEYRRFIRVGLNLFLWPALLSTLSAHRFAEAGKRHWRNAFNQIPHEILNAEPVHPPNKISRTNPTASDSDISSSSQELEDQSSNSSFDSELGTLWSLDIPNRTPSRRVTRRKRKQPYFSQGSRVGIARYHNESTVSFQMFRNTEKAFTVCLPASTRTLYACGFRAHSISHVSK
ncbi:hypothetical protein FGIG_01688 [Fasciola gigantica]|uniref:snRNA-activating protein complex subunit 4 n=1 Tax=Fasciola gigantica TaxID=46835 RepID=A0A504Y715_FASGI|nr:hypothetical protein FGIG_01688 [Fasciola gigantica]